MTRTKTKKSKALGEFLVARKNEVHEWNQSTLVSGLTHQIVNLALKALILTLKMDLKLLRTECLQTNCLQSKGEARLVACKQILKHLRV